MLWAARNRLALLLLATVALAYANSFAGSFQFDDFNVIGRELAAQYPSAWWDSQPGIRPLLKLSYALNNASGLGTSGFHAVNLLIHLGNALLVMRLFLLLTPSAQSREQQQVTALLGALIFALHPVQTEAVTYISGRSTSLAAFFALASIVLWLRAEECSNGRAWRNASLAALAAALSCKEFAVMAPAAMILCSVIRSPPGPSSLHTALRKTWPHWLLILFALAATCAIPRYRFLLHTSLEARDPISNLATQTNAIFYLAGQLIHFDRLNSDPALPPVELVNIEVLTRGAVIAALLAFGIIGVRRRNAAGFALIWFFLWLAPTNSVLPRLDVANDRELYMALIGPACALARSIGTCRIEKARRWAAPAVILALSLMTFDRNRVYADEVSFWGDVVRKSPQNERALANLGYGLAMDCRISDARKAMQAALLLDRHDWRTIVNLQLLETGDLKCNDGIDSMHQ